MPPTTPPSAVCCGAFLREILLDLVGEAGDGEGLEPDAAGAGERGEKDAVAAEDHVFDAGDALDLKGDGGSERRRRGRGGRGGVRRGRGP